MPVLRGVLATLLLGLLNCGKWSGASTEKNMALLLEGLPADRIGRLRAKQEMLLRGRPEGMLASRPLWRSKRWPPGASLSVAFRGGDKDLHRHIAEVASIWTRHGNIGLDFGDSARTGYRTWSLTDITAKAQIRVAFDQAGYWSCIGADSIDRACAGPNEASMNLGAFSARVPLNWKSIVLHAFGHALGLGDRTGECQSELRLDDDPGYVRTTNAAGALTADSSGRRPGIYSTLEGSPNNWTHEQVEHNLIDSSGVHASGGEADPDSIMSYEYPEWMYRRSKSPCFSERAGALSFGDQVSIERAYPRKPKALRAAIAELADSLRGLRNGGDLPARLRDELDARLAELESSLH